jgi:signal transduction histidine kinase
MNHLETASQTPSSGEMSTESLRKWQRIADLIASVLDAPSVMIVRFAEEGMLVDASSRSPGNPVPSGARFEIDGTHFCEVVYESRSTVVIDDARGDLRWAGSHAMKMGFVSYLGVPLHFPNGAFFGTICAFERKADAFSDKARGLLEEFREVIEWDLVLASRNRESAVAELENRRERIQRDNRVLVELATGPGIAGGDAGAFLRSVTAAVAETLGVERVSVWLHSPARTHLSCLDLFELSARSHSHGTEVAVRDYPDFFRALETERVIDAHDARADPRTSEFRTGYFERLGIVSVLNAPVRSGGRLEGVVCLEHTGATRIWTTDDQRFAGAISDLVSLALEDQRRRRTESELREAVRMNRDYVRELSNTNEELRRANEQLKELDRLKNTFLAAVSHELRTPLATIQGAVENLLTGMTGRITEMQLRMLEIISRNAGRLNRLIENLLEYSRLSSGRFSIAASHIDLRQPVRHAIENFRPLAERAGLKLVGTLPEDPVMTMADHDRIIQVATNLLDNAIRFARTEMIVSVTHVDGTAVLTVADDGPGIGGDLVSGLFQQVPRAEMRQSGTHLGLGLSIVKAIAEAHGGTVTVESPVLNAEEETPGGPAREATPRFGPRFTGAGGTCFRVSIPVRPPNGMLVS